MAYEAQGEACDCEELRDQEFALDLRERTASVVGTGQSAVINETTRETLDIEHSGPSFSILRLKAFEIYGRS